MADLPSRPDPEWLKTLKKGDAVTVAESGRLVYPGQVFKVTPSGRVVVFQTNSPGLFAPSEEFNSDGWRRGGPKMWRRYLVPASTTKREG